jgi:hypothetical protein
VGCYKNCDICVLRSGKAKKNDPPIPADLAPISGGGKRRRKPEPEAEDRALDVIKFRYRDENVFDEPTAEEELPDEMAQEHAKQSRRRHRHSKAETRKEAPAAQPLPEEVPEVQEQEPAGEKNKKNHHHYRRRHHRPKNKPHIGE